MSQYLGTLEGNVYSAINCIFVFRNKPKMKIFLFNSPISLRKAKIVYNFDLSECNRVKNRHLWKGFICQEVVKVVPLRKNVRKSCKCTTLTIGFDHKKISITYKILQ